MNKYQRMEQKIERIVELEYNKLDRLLMDNVLSTDQYHEECREIDRWAREAYEELSKMEVYLDA